MLYLSLIIILVGVVILLYSISVEVRTQSDKGRQDEPPRAPEKAREKTPDSSRAAEAKAAEPKAHAANAAVAGNGATLEAQGVLFEDRSGLVDYHGGTGTIDLDPEMEAYRKITRVGAGTMACEKNGISFYMQNRLYRFDFHRFEDFATGENYIAIKLKGGASTKLFILEKSGGVIDRIGDMYRNYLR